MKALETLRRRGPDNMLYRQVSKLVWFGFTRLAINDLSESGDQPMFYNHVWMICNGEIYNCKELAQLYDIKCRGRSDCEIILHLYSKFGFDECVKMLKGVFALVLYDAATNVVYAANDPIGVRPLFVGDKVVEQNKFQFHTMMLASEPIALHTAGCTDICFFNPGETMSFNLSGGGLSKPVYSRYYNYSWSQVDYPVDIILKRIRGRFIRAVKRRLMSDRPIGALLSGGLDSSLVCAILSKFVPNLHTFSIGMEGSPDVKYAEMVAKHIGSTHTTITCSIDEFLEVIPEVIRAVQSWCVTTVRASVGNFLIGKYISQKTPIKVVMNGDGSDEINASYKYCKYAPSPKAFYADNVRLVREVYMYDVVRSSRCMEYWGLEARTPFLDVDVVDTFMAIKPELKMVGDAYQSIEKYLLRKAFEADGLLPTGVLWRSKEAFSDGVSPEENSWHTILKNKIGDEETYYKKIFEEVLPECTNIIPKKWEPRFVDVDDVSARELK